MAISTYLLECKYRLGGLKDHIYLIPKDRMKIKYKAKGISVEVLETKDNPILLVKGVSVAFNQQETYNGKYRFQSTLTVALNEKYEEPFFYGLKELRTNQYYIIIEDKQGVQYLINCELFTKFTYEYNFTDSSDNENTCNLTFGNLSNHPLLIMQENVTNDSVLFESDCLYNIGNAIQLKMGLRKDVSTQDNGVEITKFYLDDCEKMYDVEFLKQSITVNETYDGNRFNSSLSFSIPLDDYKHYWHYDLLEFDDNLYSALVHTTNNNYIVLGTEYGLFPSYTISTGEEDSQLNTINFKFTQLSQYPIMYTTDVTQFRWVEDGSMCFGFDMYSMLKQQYSTDFCKTWNDSEPLQKKKGEIIATNSEECYTKDCIDGDEYCSNEILFYEDWREADGYVCEAGIKYKRIRKYTSTDNVTYTPTDEYGRGDMIGESDECKYVAVRWVDDGTVCLDVNPDYNRVNYDSTICVDTSEYEVGKLEVSNDNVHFYTTDIKQLGNMVEENTCDCGYRETDFYFDNEYVCNEIEHKKYEVWKEYKYCPTDETIFEETGYSELRNGVLDCDCGYRDLDWRFEGEYECNETDHKKYEIWREFYFCPTDGSFIEYTGKSELRNGVLDCDCGYRDLDWRFEGEYECQNHKKYEVWKEFYYCPTDGSFIEYTGKSELRNGVYTFDCGAVLSKWELLYDDTCGKTLWNGKNIIYEVDNPPSSEEFFE